ncbi:MAG: MFS transporter [Porticoccaceae bacterium]
MLSRLETRSIVGLAFLYATRMLGLFMVLPVLSLYASDYSGGSAITVGICLGIYGLTQGALQIPFGLASDRFGRKPLIVLGMVLFAIGSVIAALSESIYGMIIGRALQGSGAVASVIMALLSDLTREQHRTRAMAAVGGSIGLSFAAAMVLGPLVASHWGMPAVFWLTAVLSGVGMLVLLLVIPNPAVNNKGHDVIPLPAMLSRVLRDVELRRLNLGIFVLHFAQMATWVSVPLLLEQNMGFSREDHWYLYLLTMGGGFALMVPFIWWGETRRKMKPVFVGAVAVLVLSEAIMAVANNDLTVMTMGLLVFFVAFNLLEASLPSLVSKMSPAGIKGTAMGMYSTSQFLGAFCGGVLGGLVVHTFGLSSVFWLALVAALVWLAVALPMKPPRYLRSLTLEHEGSDPIAASALLGVVDGVEDVVHLPSHKVTYIKVDDERLDSAHLERVIGRTL